ncbi:hypothetical protein OK015_18015 [Mycobacterium sp. Aquia_216]|uniref:hypothetical protein n=1 Tax=Mycobacterium sp. Aquia_216 TaxID=2991729 RepID=UPI00227BBB21|nr:hypothetical protein [Mycobacterium sp. Aquia_216]WAJ43116.1 hypothetical protein OK015_18015 [Mycobacterium sp. Aquia_216]
MITKILVGGALVVGAAMGFAAPADADPSFNQLTCSCQVLAPEHGVTLEERINRGIQEAHAR